MANIYFHSDNSQVMGTPGDDQIAVFGSNDTIFGAGGNDLIFASGDQNWIVAGTGSSTIGVYGSFATVDASAGINNRIIVNGDNATIIGGVGSDTLSVVGSNALINDGAPGLGADTVTAVGSNEIISLSHDQRVSVVGNGNLVVSTSNDQVNLFGTSTVFAGGAGSIGPSFDPIGIHTINDFGNGDLIYGGAVNTVNMIGANGMFAPGGIDTVTMLGHNETLLDGASGHIFQDTVVGFDQGSDHIDLSNDLAGMTASQAVASSQLVNNGRDTLVTLGGGSTVLLQGVSHLNVSDFVG